MTNQIPAVIHFSMPKMLSSLQELALRSAERLHPGWDIRIWSDPYVPKNDIISRLLPRAKSGAQRADLIRLDCVFHEGGFYVDSDLILRSSLSRLVNYGDKLVIASEDGHHLTNAFFAAPPQHAAVAAIIGFLEMNEPDWSAPPNKTTGPELFSRILRYRDDMLVLPRETFYPYNWNEARPDKLPLGIIGVHEWENSWKGQESGESASRSRSAHIIRGLARAAKKISGQHGRRQLVNRILGASQPEVRSYSHENTITVKHKYGVFLSLDAADQSLTPSLALSGSFEPLEEAFVWQIVKGGDWFVDVGANVGVFSMIAALRCGPFGRVFAIEPNDICRRHIERAASINWFRERIKSLPVACGEIAGTASLEGTHRRLGEFRISPDLGEGSYSLYSAHDHQTIHIQMDTLDNILPGNEPIKCVKIDIEGNEDLALAGAKRLIESGCIQYFIIEYGYDAWGNRFHRFLSALKELERWGYCAMRLAFDGQGGVSCIPWPSYAAEVPHNGHVSLVFQQSRSLTSDLSVEDD